MNKKKVFILVLMSLLALAGVAAYAYISTSQGNQPIITNAFTDKEKYFPGEQMTITAETQNALEVKAFVENEAGYNEANLVVAASFNGKQTWTGKWEVENALTGKKYKIKIAAFNKSETAEKMLEWEDPNPGHSWGQIECNNNLCVDTTNGRVGIGTTSPNGKLDVNSGSNYNVRIRNTTQGWGPYTLGTDASGMVVLNASDQMIARFNNDRTTTFYNVKIECATMICKYDFNKNGTIERSEAVQAVNDYFSGGAITKAESISVVREYFSVDYVVRYDINNNREISKSEAVQAVSDYFNGTASKEETIAVVAFYSQGNFEITTCTTMICKYDFNKNGTIERSEAVQAVNDYFSGVISKADSILVVDSYLSITNHYVIRYDKNNNGIMEKSEAVQAVGDYLYPASSSLSPPPSKEEAITILDSYYKGNIVAPQ